MNRIYNILIICTIIGLLSVSNAYAGNRDRSGQAGAQHLLIDPWARSNGWGNAGVAEIRGMEAIYSNIAGMAFVKKTEIGFSRTQYLTGSGAGIGINSFAICQSLFKKDKNTGRKVKDFGVLGVSVFSQGFGDIPVTTYEQPEGNMGTFSPRLMYFGLHYAKSFNKFIHGGISVKVVNESISDLTATGIAIDAGVQYVSGAYENFKIGVTLKNIGLPISYKGDGLSQRAVITTTHHELTLETRAAEYEMPSILSMGLSYDLLFFGGSYKDMTKDERVEEGLTRDDAAHRLTFAGSFSANSYSADVFALGVEYGFMQYLMIRAGYTFELENKRSNTTKSTIELNQSTFYAGPCAGLTVAIPLVKKEKGNSKLLLDYAYRFTREWKGNHYISIKLAL